MEGPGEGTQIADKSNEINDIYKIGEEMRRKKKGERRKKKGERRTEKGERRKKKEERRKEKEERKIGALLQSGTEVEDG